VDTRFAITFDLHIVAQIKIAIRDTHHYRMCERYTHFDTTYLLLL